VAELADLSAACACDSAVLPCQLPLCSGGGDACDAMILTVSVSSVPHTEGQCGSASTPCVSWRLKTRWGDFSPYRLYGR
jgi:hypothetical protein